jgi:hypothetical protein
MYTQAWSKYVSVLHILLKRAIASEQTFDLNVADFKRSGATRKSGYKFEVVFNGGRPATIQASDIAKDFVTVLLENPKTLELLQAHNYTFTMNTKFQLQIKHIAKEEAVEEPQPEEQVNQ